MSRFAKLSLFFIIIILGILLHLKNNQIIEFNYYVGSIEIPVSLLLVLALITGAILGMLSSLPMLLRLKSEKTRLEKLSRVTEKEINSLRVMPMKD